MTDLQYIEQGLFTAFVPDSEQGEQVWTDFLKQNNGSNKVLTIHAKSVISQIKKAGYTVSKAKKVTKSEMNKILAELELI